MSAIITNVNSKTLWRKSDLLGCLGQTWWIWGFYPKGDDNYWRAPNRAGDMIGITI